MTRLGELVESVFVKKLFFLKRFLVGVSACAVFLCLPMEVLADILVRVPPGTSPEYTAALIEALKQSTGAGAISVSARMPKADKNLAEPPEELKTKLEEAETAYKRLELEKALLILDGTDVECMKSASFEACRSFLFDSALLRGMSLFALSRADDADQEFRSAHAAYPAKVLDPKKYSPNILRAFAAACVENDTAPAAEIRLVADPKESILVVNGKEQSTSNVRLSAGRHVIEARLPGFDETFLFVEVTSEGKAADTIMLRPTPKSDVNAWADLAAAVSRKQWSPTEPGVDLLLSRFSIDSVLMLTLDKDGASMNARLARAGRRDTSELPPLAASENDLSPAFEEALKNELGIAPPRTSPPVVLTGPSNTPPTTYEDDNEEDDSAIEDNEEDDEEESSIQYEESLDDSSNAKAERNKKILKSPWLWISVGVVAAIVTGVVVSVQVQD